MDLTGECVTFRMFAIWLVTGTQTIRRRTGTGCSGTQSYTHRVLCTLAKGNVIREVQQKPPNSLHMYTQTHTHIHAPTVTFKDITDSERGQFII